LPDQALPENSATQVSPAEGHLLELRKPAGAAGMNFLRKLGISKPSAKTQ
jgi:hypothetical protein